MGVPVPEELVPTYQYACTACGHGFEAVQSFSDSSLTDCPECAGRLRKVFSSVGIVFKGSGFYRTDSRAAAGGSEKSATEPSVPAAASAGKDSGSTSSTESKKSDTGSKTPSSSGSSGSSSGSTSSAPAAAAS